MLNLKRKSLFLLGILKGVYNEDEAKEFINKIKSEHKEARHNVYAYVIGENMGIQRYSDDGEPQGTGGIPVLEVIKKNEITDASSGSYKIFWRHSARNRRTCKSIFKRCFISC